MTNPLHLPKLSVTKSNILGSAGLYDENGNITICTDFPFWFVLIIALHELGHYADDTIGTIFYKMDCENDIHPRCCLVVTMEVLSEKLIMCLSRKYRERCKHNSDTFTKYLRNRKLYK